MRKKPGPKPKSPQARARDGFFWSDEGAKLYQGSVEGIYLINRLERAFIAGWDACEEHTKAAKK